MILKGYLSNYENGALTVIAPLEDDYQIIKQNITECEIRLDDGRTISADQRKKAYATMRDIAEYTGYLPEQVKALAKYDFIAQTGYDHYFSLSDVDMSTAREFLEYLIEFCVENDIPTMDSLLDRSPDIARYLYCCLVNKKCAICGKKADLHHVDHVGMGRNRKEICHKGMHVEPLCRIHHTECHNIGQQTFNEKYHIFGIKLDDYLCGVLKLKGEE